MLGNARHLLQRAGDGTDPEHRTQDRDAEDDNGDDKHLHQEVLSRCVDLITRCIDSEDHSVLEFL